MNSSISVSGPETGLPRVLIVDDNQDLLHMMVDIVSLMGYDVRSATDAGSGIEQARLFRPHLILCDIGLPDMPGYEVARAVRADAAIRDAYMIAISGYGLNAHITECVEAGFDNHLQKPVSMDTLNRLMGEVMDLSAAGQGRPQIFRFQFPDSRSCAV